MHKIRFSSHRNGFSLVELLVALVFIGLLMAGMAKVYQSSLNISYVSGETISSGRRNRVAMDMLYDDLNAAGQYLTNMTVYPTFSAANPGFYIVPNQPFSGTDIVAAKAVTDQLYLYLDEALPFEGCLMNPNGTAATFATTSNADLVASGADIGALNRSMTVKFLAASHAAMVKDGQFVVFKDQWGPKQIKNVAVSGNLVTFEPVDQPDNEKGLPTGVNPLNKDRHYAGDGNFTNPTLINPSAGGAPVVFVRAGQMVRYSIQPQFLDPSDPAVALPCLIREQGTYTTGAFVPNPALQSIIAENVTGFKVYLSADGGRTWAGQGLTANDFLSGWTNGILSTVNTQLASVGLPSAINASDPNWFRETPLMVRVDLTTRSAVKRVENAAVANTAEYRERLQTLYMVPRHFGLSYK
ncbi:MAG TPA: type II secretion system protein [Geothrix sp.]|nr:type II secretion system protein [Geothrix sp.]